MIRHALVTVGSMILALALGLLPTGCGGAQTAAETGPGDDAYEPTNLYPLGAGYVWSYDVDNGIESILSVTQVIAAVGNRFELSSGGDPVVYEVRPGGIYRPTSSTWLLKSPIVVGAEWDAPGGRIARVTSITATVEVPAGRFENCVRIEETGGEDQKEIQTVYCPNVGPIFLETSMQLTLTEVPPRVLGRLRGCNLRERNDGTVCFEIMGE